MKNDRNGHLTCRFNTLERIYKFDNPTCVKICEIKGPDSNFRNNYCSKLMKVDEKCKIECLSRFELKNNNVFLLYNIFKCNSNRILSLNELKCEEG